MKTNEVISSPEQTNSPLATEIPASQKSVVSKFITSRLLGISVVLLLGTTGTFAYKYYELKRQLDRQQPALSIPPAEVTITSPSPAQSPSPLSTVDPISDWETYKSTEGNYFVRYPRQWSVKELGPLGSLTQNISNVVLVGEEDIGHYNAQLTISVSNTDADRRIAEDEIQGGEKFNLDGVTASKWLDSKEKRALEYILAIKGDFIYRITLECLSRECFESNKQYYLDNVNLILSTFKFTN